MQIQEHVSLATYTTLQVGGQARYLVHIQSVAELESGRQLALRTAVPILVLGSGSNVLIPDAGYPGLVVINNIAGSTYTDAAETGYVYVRFGAGELLDAIVAQTIQKQYWGLENLSHIPGTIGAAPVQNVGAYGVELSAIVHSVEAFSVDTGEVRSFTNEQCAFAYRDSFFKSQSGRQWIITHVTCQLSKHRNPVLSYGDLQTLDADVCTSADIRQTVIDIRKTKFPDWHTIGTAGSFFKNPIITPTQHQQLMTKYPGLVSYVQPNGTYKVSLGWILDKVCHLRGYSSGKVGLYQDQALVLVNTGNSATDIAQFAANVSQQVHQKTGITIEPEVRFV